MLGRNELVVWCVNGHKMIIPLYALDLYQVNNFDHDVTYVNIVWKCIECNADTCIMICEVPRD